MNLSTPIRFVPLCLCGILVVAGCAMFESPDARRGDQHLAAGNWEEASLAYRQALKDDPFDFSLQNKYAVARERSAAMHEERARELLKLRQLDMAIEEFKRALFQHIPEPEPIPEESPEGLADFLVYRPQPRTRRYRIFRTDTGYRVVGRPPGDEELAEALKAAGAKKGDEVEIEGELVELG